MINIKKVLITLIYIVLLFSFFKPDSISYIYPSLNNIYKIFQYLSIFGALIILILNKKVSKMVLLCSLYFAILSLSTLFSSINYSVIFYSIINISLLIIIESGLKNHLKEFLKAISLIFNILIIINFISIILYPKGLYVNTMGYYTNWILGYKNTHILFLLPAIFFNFISSYVSKNRIDLKSIIIFIISIISTILVGNSTAIVGLSIILLFLIFENRFIKIISNIYINISIYIISFFSIVVFRAQYLLKYIIVDLLKKDLTFTGRIYIWDDVLKKIQMKPVIGYGNYTFQYSKNIVTTHNTILDILYKTGITGLIFYLMIIIVSAKKIFEYRNERIAKIISIVFFSYFIMMLTEAYNLTFYSYLFIFAYNIKYLVKGSE